MEKNRRFRSLKDRIMRKKMFARVVKVLIGIILVFPAQAQEKQQRVSLSVARSHGSARCPLPAGCACP